MFLIKSRKLFVLSQKGFTLLEVLIALATFLVIASITSSVLYYSFNVRDKINKHADKLSALQITTTLLQRDITQIIERPIRDSEDHFLPAFIGLPTYIEFTHSGLFNPDSLLKRSSLQRTAWICNDNKLRRRTFTNLDTISHKQYEEKIFLTDLASCSFAYLDYSLQVLSKWQVNAVQQKLEPFPKAIRLDLVLKENKQKISLLFIIPQALYA